MIKKLLTIALIAGFIVSCTPKTEQKIEDTILEPSITEVLSSPMDFDGKEVIISGIISHVCKHSGDKMRVMQTDGELSVLVMLGDFAGQITPENEGEFVDFEGTIEVKVRNMDAIEEEHEHEHEEGHECSSTEEAIAKMKEKGIDPDLAVLIHLKKYELK